MVALAVWLSRPWLADLTGTVGAPLGWVIVTLLAYVPGFVVALLAVSLVLDRQPPLRVASPTTGVTVVIAARNEAAGIGDTIRYVAASRYDGPLRIVLADNGSTDATAEAARAAAEEVGAELVVVREETPGKAHALNRALKVVDTPYLVTVDADTLLHPNALRRLVSRLESAPPDTVAVAGAVLVRNSRANLLTRMQEWDCYLGIASAGPPCIPAGVPGDLLHGRAHRLCPGAHPLPPPLEVRCGRPRTSEAYAFQEVHSGFQAKMQVCMSAPMMPVSLFTPPHHQSHDGGGVWLVLSRPPAAPR